MCEYNIIFSSSNVPNVRQLQRVTQMLLNVPNVRQLQRIRVFQMEARAFVYLRAHDCI